MLQNRAILVIALGLVVSNIAGAIKPPVLNSSKSYHTTGQIAVLRSDIIVPFEFWNDASDPQNPRQRLDYYNGQDSTFQFPNGSQIYIVPTGYSTSCLIMSMFADVSPVAVLPDLSTFLFVNRTDIIRGIRCHAYVSEVAALGRTYKYTFHVSSDKNLPVQMHVLEHDDLLGKDSDEYRTDYFSYEEGPIRPGVFGKLDSFKCQVVSPQAEPSFYIQHNPFELYPVGPSNSGEHPAESSFKAFKEHHGIEYESELEHRNRLHVYINNLRYIASVNRKQNSYKLAVNHLADRFEDELRIMRPNKGRFTKEGLGDTALYTYTADASKDLPDEIDWRTKGAVTAIKDQGFCGSCWAFGSSETIEGALFLKTGKLVRLSAQALVDCSWEFDNLGCNGGSEVKAYEWIMKAGYIPTEESYPYKMQDGYCRYESSDPGTEIQGYVNVASKDAQALRQALVEHGPIQVSINSDLNSFKLYKSGMYYDEACGGELEELDHSVLVVGYGFDSQSNDYYWIIKNSWGTTWGEEGYMKMSAKNNICGVTTKPTFVVI